MHNHETSGSDTALMNKYHQIKTIVVASHPSTTTPHNVPIAWQNVMNDSYPNRDATVFLCRKVVRRFHRFEIDTPRSMHYYKNLPQIIWVSLQSGWILTMIVTCDGIFSRHCLITKFAVNQKTNFRFTRLG